MACQPTIQVGLLFLVAFDAKTHPKIHALDPVHGFHRSMALGTGDLLLDMPFVVENHVFGEVVGLSPWCGRLCVKIPVLLLDFGMIRYDVFMAVKAFLHRGNARMD